MEKLIYNTGTQYIIGKRIGNKESGERARPGGPCPGVRDLFYVFGGGGGISGGNPPPPTLLFNAPGAPRGEEKRTRV